VIPPQYRHKPTARLVDGLTREEACVAHQDRILRLANRLADRTGVDCPVPVEDLVGYGVIGLLEAFDQFDPHGGADFNSYSSLKILGVMWDALRSAGLTTRKERKVTHELHKVIQTLFNELGREPEHTEIAARMGLDMEDYWQMRSWAEQVALEPLPPSLELPHLPSCVVEPEGPRQLLAADARRVLRDAIEALEPRDRNAILLYYARGMNLAEIAAVLSITPSRVCQILSAARNRLRRALGGEFDVQLFETEAA